MATPPDEDDVFLDTVFDLGETLPPDGYRAQSETPDTPGNKRIILYRRSTSSYSDDNLEPLTGKDISSLKKTF